MAQQIGSLLPILSVFVLSSNAVKCPGMATYTLSWKADWTKANHPMTALPSGAHFSDLIGCSHSADYIMWRRGQKASAGVKLVAERGQTGTLRSEIETQISDGKAWQLILPGSELGAVGELTNIQVNVTSNFSRVSLISMLAPSPDWFVGIDSHDLCDNGQWRETWNVTMLPPYDSGTDSGQQFRSSNLPTQPSVDIFRITPTMDGVFKAQNPIPSLGEFQFKGLNLPVIQINHSYGLAKSVIYKPTSAMTTKHSQTTTALNLAVSQMNNFNGSAPTVMYKSTGTMTTKHSQTTTALNLVVSQMNNFDDSAPTVMYKSTGTMTTKHSQTTTALNLVVSQMSNFDGSATTVVYKPTTKNSQTTTALTDSASKDSVGVLLFIMLDVFLTLS